MYSRPPCPQAMSSTNTIASRRGKLQSSEYLGRHQVSLYLEDVISLLLQVRSERPLDFLANYFAEVNDGKHVLCREFEYVNASTHNRWSFIVTAQEAFGEFDQAQITTNAELLQLFQLICHDFPEWLVRDAANLCGNEQGPHPLAKLLHAAVARLFFGEFLRWISNCFVMLDCFSSRHTSRP